MIPRIVLTLFTLSLFAAPVAANAAGMPSCKSGDPVVWVNTNSHVYHMQGDQYYGKTKSGDYECESAAEAVGNHKSGSASKSATAKSSPAAMKSPAAMASPAAMTSPSAKKKKSHKATPSPAPSASP